LGTGTTGEVDNIVLLGYNASVTDDGVSSCDRVTALGTEAVGFGQYSIALGARAICDASRQMVIGAGTGISITEVLPGGTTCDLGSAARPFQEINVGNVATTTITALGVITADGGITANNIVQDLSIDVYASVAHLCTLNADLLPTPLLFQLPFGGGLGGPNWTVLPSLQTTRTEHVLNASIDVNNVIRPFGAGRYMVDYSVSNSTPVITNNYYFTIVVNGNVQNSCICIQRKQTNDRFETTSKSVILDLPINAIVTLQAACSNHSVSTNTQCQLNLAAWSLSLHKLSEST
jgi:hypothetical protein